MNMRSPIVAMLWENWQVSRLEAAQRFALGLVAGAGALVLLPAKIAGTVAFAVIAVIHSMIWFSIAKLNGGRFMDGYKPGFPFYLLYARPVSTVTFVGVTMAYDAISCVVLYLVSAALVGIPFGKQLPLFSMILFLVTCHLAYACVQWSTRNRVVQWVGSMAYSLPMFFLISTNLSPSLQVEFSLAENAVMILVCIVSFGLAVAGIKRQRRGDAVASELQPKTAMGGYPELLLRFFPFRCPTSSATRAQLWFEFKSSGMPVLTIGLGISLLLLLLFAISVPVVPVRDIALGIAFFSVPIVLFALGNNAFGIRRKQGRTYASSFEMTQPYGTAQLVGLKTFVRTACVLAAMLALGASLWASSSFIGEWGEWKAIGVNKDAVPGLLEMREEFAETFGGLTGLAFAALAVVAAITIATLINWQAAREALRVRYPRRLFVVQWLPAVMGFVVVLMALADRKGIVSDGTARSFYMATFWVTGAAMLISAIYFLWNGIATRVLTIRYILGALAIAAIFGVAWRVGIAAGNVFGISWLALGILMVIVLAPWALSRVRHA